jgi:hypothetical protein
MTMIRIFKFPQDIPWIIAASLLLMSIVLTSIFFNLVALLIGIATLLAFVGIWFMVIFRPWYRIHKSLQFTCEGIKFCYRKSFEIQEKIQIRSIIGTTEQKITSSLALSKVCVIDDAFSDLVVYFVDSINTDYYNRLMCTNYKKIFGITNGKAILVDVSNGIINSALAHELGHAILDSCSNYQTEQQQHEILSNVSL